MCFFPIRNKSSIKARLKGVEEFDCGGCPECLAKKSRQWALRCAMEAKVNVGMMITLTYDTYKNGVNGEENPVDTSIEVNKAHCQRFVKRLRKAYPNNLIKYLITAEYGKRTHRAHYHALIFGVQFNDLVFYKKSKRGNIIYKSKTLEKIWSSDKMHNGGICTVDCVNPSAQVARYCTKYCAKDSGVDETFMLFSHGIGEKLLLEKFNGKSYWLDGREYSIPRLIWQKVIEKKYKKQGYFKYCPRYKVEISQKKLCRKLDMLEKQRDVMEERKQRTEMYIETLIRYKPKKFRSKQREANFEDKFKRYADRLLSIEIQLKEVEELKKQSWYVEYNKLNYSYKAFERSKEKRDIIADIRDKDSVYKRYLTYWKHKNNVNNIGRPDVLTRVIQLNDSKYRSYKYATLTALNKQKRGFDFVPPRTKSTAFIKFKDEKVNEEKSFSPLSRHYRLNDTSKNVQNDYRRLCGKKILQSMKNCAYNSVEDPFSIFYKII